MYKCRCGVAFTNESDLRMHIALLISRWPARRCDEAHHDPDNYLDTGYLYNQHITNKLKDFCSGRSH